MIRRAYSLGLALFCGSIGVVGPQTPAAAQVCDGWVPIGDPIQRGIPAMAVDHQSKRLFLYGGGFGISNDSTGTGCSDLWQLQAGRWRPAVEISGPLARFAPVLVWDEARARLVLIGGGGTVSDASASVNRTKTWEFDGEVWSDRGAIGGPVDQNSAAGDFDPGRACTWAVSANRLWRYDGTAWQEQLNPGGGAPWPFFGRPHAAFDRAAGVLRVISTRSGGGALWTWDGSTWQTHAASTIDAVGLSYDATLGRVVAAVIAGGQIQFRGWNGAAWEVETGLPAITLTGTTSDASVKIYRDEQGRPGVVIAGGSVTTPQLLVNGGESLVISAVVENGQWVSRTIPATPRARFKPALAYSPPQGGTVMVGGSSVFNWSGPTAFDDTWLLRGDRWQQLPVGGLAREYGVPLFYNRQSQLLTVIGASAGGQTTLHELTPQGWVARQIPGVGVGRDRVAVWDTAREYAVIAGYSSTSPLARCDGQSVGSIALTPNFPNQSTASLVYDEGRQRTVVAGMQSSPTVYQINGTAWSSFQSTGGFNSYNPLLCYDPARGGTVAFGGFLWYSSSDGFPTRTAFLGSTSSAWATLPAWLPVGFKFTTTAWDEDAQRIVAFGGLLPGNGASRMTVRLSQGPAEIGVPPVAEADGVLGETTTLEAVARGGGILRYQWLKDDEPLAESLRIRGVDTDRLQILETNADDAGVYTLRVTNRCGTDTSLGSRVTVTNQSCLADIGRTGGLPGPDGQLDNNDFIVFIGFFFEGHPLADIGAAGGVDLSDGQFDNNDFIVFINRFFTACP